MIMLKIKRTGEKVTWKEFFKRWKKGMEEITPLQQTLVTQIGYFTVFVGIIWGIIFSIRAKSYWLAVILIGSFIVSSTSFLGNWQKRQILLKIEKSLKGGKNV